ncbi:MAG: hypothetical protein IT210_03720 [Armatimonadetes bacterium]|nr:hypothetical protein [Armatimonadota bacterium]
MDLNTTPYISALAGYPGFPASAAEDEKLPPWSYMPPEAPSLAELREDYGLARMCAGLSELDTILKLLQWAYDAMEYDGGSPGPAKRDALTILRFGQPVNCALKAIVLDEAFLSMGFFARYITCLPAAYDGDCHVIVLVYARSLGKWLSVDPSHNTFFMGADGTILNILEARSIFRTGKAPAMRPIAREMAAPMFCGGIPCASYDEFYQVYMAKNSFRFACPVASASGYDSDPDARFIVLNPPGYRPDSEQPYRMAGRDFPTNNAAYFLAKPDGKDRSSP